MRPESVLLQAWAFGREEPAKKGYYFCIFMGGVKSFAHILGVRKRGRHA